MYRNFDLIKYKFPFIFILNIAHWALFSKTLNYFVFTFSLIFNYITTRIWRTGDEVVPTTECRRHQPEMVENGRKRVKMVENERKRVNTDKNVRKRTKTFKN